MPPSNPSKNGTPHTKGKILIVDDDLFNLKFLEQILLHEGYSAQTIDTGATAIEAINRIQPDIILLDIKLPDVDGYQICRDLKKDAILSPIPVIFISSLDESIDKVKAFKAGGVDYITKPFEPEVVIARVEAHLTIRLTQKKLEFAFNELEQRVKERTNDLLITNMRLEKENQERKQMENALRESEEKYRQLFENEMDALMIFDAETLCIENINKAALSLFQYTKKEFIALKMTEIATEKKKLQKTLHNTIQQKKEYPHVPMHAFQKKDGTSFIGETSTGIFEISGRRKMFAAIRDISDRRKLEEKLRQAYKMEAIGTLAGGIAHDFNNILSAIIGFTELCIDDCPPGSILRENMQEVYAAGKRAKDLTHQILTFSRYTEQELKPIRIYLIIKEALKFLRASLPSNIDIQKNIQSNKITMADPTQVHQIIMNLCTNARHAMQSKGGGILKVDLVDVSLDEAFVKNHPGLSAGDYIKLTVKDTGTGMTPEIVERIFDPFFTTKDKGDGTGMGLSVVHGIIKHIGGGITVDSTPGLGTAMSVYFPSIEKKGETESIQVPQVPSGSEQILLVDDERPIIRMGKRLLESLGYKVTTTTNSRRALKLVKDAPERFDLIITDMTMPKMTGDRLSQELLKIKPDLPIILCTGFSEHISALKAQDIGIRMYIEKPLNKQIIGTAIRQVLDTAP